MGRPVRFAITIDPVGKPVTYLLVVILETLKVPQENMSEMVARVLTGEQIKVGDWTREVAETKAILANRLCREAHIDPIAGIVAR